MPDQQSDFFSTLKCGGIRPAARNVALTLLAAVVLGAAGSSAAGVVATGQGRQPKVRPTPIAYLNVTITSDAPETDIYIPEGEKIGTTDKDGKLLVRLPPNTYKGMTRKQGYAPRPFTITVVSSQTTFKVPTGEALPRATPPPNPSPTPADAGDAAAANGLIERFRSAKQTGQVKVDDWKNFLKVTYQDLAREPNSAKLNAQAQFALGQLEFLGGNYANAQHAFNSALRYVPDHALAAYGLGNTHLAMNEAEAAVKAFQRALSADPKLGMAYKGWGDALRVLKKEKEAREAYALAGERGFLSREVRIDLARSLVEDKKWLEAIAALKALAADEPAARDNGVVYMLLGDSYKGLNQKRNAFDHYKEAVSRDEGLARAHYMIGEFEYEEKNWEKARDAYNTALKLAPADKEIINRAKQRAREADEKLLKLKDRLP